MKAPQGAFLWLYAFNVLAVTPESKSRTGAIQVTIKFCDRVLIALATFYRPCTAFGFFSGNNFVLSRALHKLAAAGVDFDWVFELLGGAASGTDIGIQFGLAIRQQVGAIGKVICVCGCL